MKACLDCKIVFKNDERDTCPKCGGTNLRYVVNGRIVNTSKSQEKPKGEKESVGKKGKKPKEKVRNKQDREAKKSANGTYVDPEYGPVALDIQFGEWLVFLLKTMIPVFGTLFLVRHAIGSPKDSPTKKNLCRAYIVVFLLQMALLVGIVALLQRLQLMYPEVFSLLG